VETLLGGCESGEKSLTLTVALSTVLYRRTIYRRIIYRRFSPSVLPINRIAAPTFVALGVFAVLGDDGPRVTSGAHQVWLAHHTPGAGPLAANLEIRFREWRQFGKAVTDWERRRYFEII